MDLVFVGDRCCDHSPSSGYDQICALFPEAGWLGGRSLVAGQLSWHRQPTRPALHPARSPQLFHVFYGDCSGNALPALLRSRFPQATIISTVHQPVARLERDPAGWRSLDPVDALVTVSRIQARELADRALRTTVHAIPHGVWTQKFRPPLRLTPVVRDSILLVGNYLRDWHAAKRIVEMLADAGVKSVVLGSDAPSRLPIAHPLVEIRQRVCEAELAELYDRAAALLLPVTDATASNALLEAMAAGCPVVCPRFPSLVDEYLGYRCDSFEPGRYDIAVARLVRYVRQPELRAARSSELRRRAEEFDWSSLRSRYATIFQEIAAHPPARRAHFSGRG